MEGRCQELRKQIADTTSAYDREKLEERLAKLSGGVAVIRVGAPAEAEMKSRREAFDDAISATRAAIAEGIVPGAGLALLRTIPAVETEAARAAGDERAGMQILRRALENAVSVAGVLLLTDATMTEVPEEKPAAGVPAMEGV